MAFGWISCMFSFSRIPMAHFWAAAHGRSLRSSYLRPLRSKLLFFLLVFTLSFCCREPCTEACLLRGTSLTFLGQSSWKALFTLPTHKAKELIDRADLST